MEVEWTLGYALAEIQPALIQKEQRALQLGHTKNSAWKTGQVNVIAAWMSRIKSLLKYISRAMKFLNIYLAIFS